MAEKSTDAFGRCEPDLQRLFSSDPTNCFVLLEQLDKKILTQYLQKLRLHSRTPVRLKRRTKQHDKREEGQLRPVKKYSQKQRSYSGVRKGETRNSGLKSDPEKPKKRKTRVKCLCYTDDEDDCSRINLKEKIPEKTGGDAVCVPLTAAPPDEVLNSKNDSDFNTVHEKNIKDSKRNLEPNEPNEIQKAESKTEKRKELIKVEVQDTNEISFCKNFLVEKQLKPRIQISGLNLQNDRQIFVDRMDLKNNKGIDYAYSRVVEIEAEIGQESKGYINLERTIDWIKEEIDMNEVKEGCARKLEKEVSEAGDSDLREDDEDDRETVIFEESFNDAFNEIFEIANEKIGNVKKKFKKKKITNRKKRRLVKFKRKRSMMGRNFAKVKKHRNAYSELSGSGQADESVSERCMKEVCGLVKRLHELYKIILQPQKELPKNYERAEHFKGTINTQQKNLCTEMKKNQQTIIQGYDKMLNRYGNANTVSREIGRRTSLSKEDVAYVISRCRHTGAPCEERKREGGAEEQELNCRETSPKSFGITPSCSEKLEKLIDDKIEALLLMESVQELSQAQSVQVEKSGKKSLDSSLDQQAPDNNIDTVSMPPPQSNVPSGNRRSVKSHRRPHNEFKTARQNTAEEILETIPSNLFLRGSLFPCNDVPWQWSAPSKPRPHFHPQKNFPYRAHCLPRDPTTRHSSQDCTRFNQLYMHINQIRPLSQRLVSQSQFPDIRAEHRGNGFPAQGTVTNYPPSNDTVGLFQVPNHCVLPAPGRNTGFPTPSLMSLNPFPSGCNQERLPLNQFSHISSPGSFSSTVPLQHDFDRSSRNVNAMSQTKSQIFATLSPKSLTNSRKRNVFSSSKCLESNSVVSAPSEEFPRDEQYSLKNSSTSFATYSHPNTSKYTMQTSSFSEVTLNPGDEMCGLLINPMSTESQKPASCALDPTVPQKLTMRNCRLEAGPILETKSGSIESGGDGTPIRWHHPSAEEATFINDGGGSDLSNVKDLNSRVYVCAQNGCKNIGVRICKGCLSVIYCGETCQLKHWTVKHKSECHQLMELRG